MGSWDTRRVAERSSGMEGAGVRIISCIKGAGYPKGRAGFQVCAVPWHE